MSVVDSDQANVRWVKEKQNCPNFRKVFKTSSGGMQIESTKSNHIATINLNAAINSTNICMVHKNIANMCKLNATSTAKFKIVLIITNELSVPCSVTF